jgi:hypothetical protein
LKEAKEILEKEVFLKKQTVKNWNEFKNLSIREDDLKALKIEEEKILKSNKSIFKSLIRSSKTNFRNLKTLAKNQKTYGEHYCFWFKQLFKKWKNALIKITQLNLTF